MKRRHLLVVAAVIERNDEILVSLRHPKGDRPSQWEFPGGKVERGESEPQALARELREEMDVECKVGPMLRRLTHSYPDIDVEIAFYQAEIVSGEPKALEMAEIRWVKRSEIERLDFLEADRPFVADLARGAA